MYLIISQQEKNLLNLTFLDVKHFQIKSEVSLRFIANKMTKEKFCYEGSRIR